MIKNRFNIINTIKIFSLVFLLLFTISFNSNIQKASACYDYWDCDSDYGYDCPPGTIPSGWDCIPTGGGNNGGGNYGYDCPPGTIPSGWDCIPVNNNYFMCPDGTRVMYSWQCPQIPQTPQYVPPYYPPYPQQDFICPNGLRVQYSWQCPQIPQTPQMQTCWNGSVIPVTQSCPQQYQTCWNGTIILTTQTCPTRTQVCPDGSIIPITQTCPTRTQTCWNGSVIPVTQSCPQQYQTCWDGSIILMTKTCPVKTTTTVKIIKVDIKEHSVVTDLATKITTDSAQCNGIANIKGGVGTTAWFEFGETSNVKSTTNSAFIGSSQQITFSNLITGLKSNTTYYCRAVISNKDGTYRGKIVSFKTKEKTKTVITYPTTNTTKKLTTKTEFVCADGSIAKAKTVLVGEAINSGKKLLDVKIERSQEDLIQGSSMNYKITITNNADIQIDNVELKTILPSEMDYANLATSSQINIKDGIMSVFVGSIEAQKSKTFILPVKILKEAEIGKTIVTTVYVGYNLPVEGDKVIRDEVSTYMMGNITSQGASNTENKVSKSIFPETLLGWLALFSIILILTILIINITKWYNDRKRARKDNTIHHHIA